MALPSTPMLDDFSRPDENPLLGQAGWANLDSNFTDVLRITNNRCAAAVGDAGSFLPTSYEVTEVWSIAVISTGSFGLLTRIQGAGGAGTYDGYMGVIGGTVTQIFRVTNGTPVSITSVITVSSAQDGDVWVMRSEQNTHTLYRVRSGSVQQVVSVTDRSFRTGQIGLYLTSSVTTVRRFGGGTIDSLVAPAHGIGGFGAI